MIRLLAAWAALMALLGTEALAAASHHGEVGWAAAPVMVGIVAAAFMHAARASALSRVFAVAGLFWIAILLMLGTADFAARRVAEPAVRSSG